jgi:hypothetical protein
MDRGGRLAGPAFLVGEDNMIRTAGHVLINIPVLGPCEGRYTVP